MAQTFNNGESNLSIRNKLNANAGEINDNTADIASLETEKQDTLVSGTNIKTINGSSVMGSGNLVISGTVTDGDKGDVTVSGGGTSWTVPDLALKAPLNSPAFTGTVTGISKTMVGLGNVDNTSDAAKPVSTATQTALDGKVPTTRMVAGKPLSSDVTLAKGDVGLGNVDNTSDANKPISNATAVALNGKASTDAGTLTSGTLADARLSGNVPIKVAGLIKVEDLPNALLSSDQFEMLIDGTIGIKTSYLESLGLGGLPVPTAPTITVSGRNLSAIHPSYPGQLQYSINNGAYADYADETPIDVGLSSVVANYYKFRVKANAGVNNAGTVAGNPFIPSDSGSYVVENTVIVNFSSEFTAPAANPPFNNLQPPSSDIQVDNGYTSPLLENTSGVDSTITVTNSGAFSGQSAMISATQDAAGDTGVFVNQVVNTAWGVTGSTDAALLIAGLNASKFFQFYFLMPVDTTDSVRGVTINGVTKNRTATTILGSFGQAANGLNDPEWIVFNNITGVTSITAAIERVSGDFGAHLSCMVIEQSNIAKP